MSSIVKKNKEKAFNLGVLGYQKGLKNAPCLNIELMNWLNCDFNSWEDEIMKNKIKIYKSYIKGWTQEHLKTMVVT